MIWSEKCRISRNSGDINDNVVNNKMSNRASVFYLALLSAILAILVATSPYFGQILLRQIGFSVDDFGLGIVAEQHDSSLATVKTKKWSHPFCSFSNIQTEHKNQLTFGNSEVTAQEDPEIVSNNHNVKSGLSEASAARARAREMASQGKIDKALKIYLHALALNPQHPDLLNEYGEFLEKNEKDVLSAEHQYCRVLMIMPSHTKALANRRRTLPLVEEIDHNLFKSIDEKRDMLVQVPDNHPGLRRMIHESYFQHIHHTTGIEGNTFTLSQTRSLVETRLAIGGKSVMEHNEILGMDAALNFINSSIIQRFGAIKLSDILEIHRRVLGFVDPIEAGHFRKTQVFVGDFTPPNANEVQGLMDEFIEWVNSDEALSLHPIELSALAHYKFVYIHPFYDGNGRTSRLLMNLVLMQAGYPPIIIKKEEKHEYYKHLQTANDGDVRPFIRFIARCTERTVNEYLLATVENFNVTYPSLINVHKDDGRTIIVDED